MKGTSWEGGYRVPFIARWPGRFPAGHVSAEPAVMMDLFTTTLGHLRHCSSAGPCDRRADILPLAHIGRKKSARSDPRPSRCETRQRP